MKSEADSIRQGRLPQEQCIEPAVNGVWKHGARKHNDERSLQSTSAYAHDLPPSTDTTGRQNHMTSERKTNVNGWIRVCSTSTLQSQIYVTHQLHQYRRTHGYLYTHSLLWVHSRSISRLLPQRQSVWREAGKCESALGSRNLWIKSRLHRGSL